MRPCASWLVVDSWLCCIQKDTATSHQSQTTIDHRAVHYTVIGRQLSMDGLFRSICESGYDLVMFVIVMESKNQTKINRYLYNIRAYNIPLSNLTMKRVINVYSTSVRP